ncbi:MAG: hypothetical protein ABSE79_05510 [Terriglobia bacterium]
MDVRELVDGREPLERGRACALTTFGEAGPGSAVVAAALAAAVTA